MHYQEARERSNVKRILGVAIAAPSLVSTVISFLKMVYFRLDDGTQFGSALARPFKQAVSWVYEKTQFLNFFWDHSPVPDQFNLSEIQNLYALIIYFGIFVGVASYASGRKMAARLAVIDKKIEDQLIEESVKGANGRSRQEIEQSTAIPSNSVFAQAHQLYLAPIIVGIIVAVFVGLLGI